MVPMSADVYVYGPVPIADGEHTPGDHDELVEGAARDLERRLNGRHVRADAKLPASASVKVTTVVGYVSDPPDRLASRSVKHSSIWSAVGCPAGTGEAT